MFLSLSFRIIIITCSDTNKAIKLQIYSSIKPYYILNNAYTPTPQKRDDRTHSPGLKKRASHHGKAQDETALTANLVLIVKSLS